MTSETKEVKNLEDELFDISIDYKEAPFFVNNSTKTIGIKLILNRCFQVGGLYDFIVATFGLWNENFTTRVVGFGEMLADKAKLVFKVNTGAAVLGLGYIVGLKYALIICLGSLAVWWLVVPGMALLFGDSVLNEWNPTITTAVGNMSPEQIFKEYGKSIGIGAIAMAGIIGIIKSWGIIKGAISLASKEMKGGNKRNFRLRWNPLYCKASERCFPPSAAVKTISAAS